MIKWIIAFTVHILIDNKYINVHILFIKATIVVLDMTYITLYLYKKAHNHR